MSEKDIVTELRAIGVKICDEAADEIRRLTGQDTMRRYEWKIVPALWGHPDDHDQICIDRVTNKIVIRYDLGDPANYNPEYGGLSKDEYLERKGLNPDERIPTDRARAIAAEAALAAALTRAAEMRDILASVRVDVQLLDTAIECNDPHRELRIRTGDILQRIATAIRNLKVGG